MKGIGVPVVLLLLAGCSTSTPRPIAEGTLGVGRYEISMPNVMTNRPQFIAQQCGRLDVCSVPFDGKTHWETHVRWPDGEVDVFVSGTNENNLAYVQIWSDGTNVFLNVNEATMSGPVYTVERTGNGRFRLRELKK